MRRRPARSRTVPGPAGRPGPGGRLIRTCSPCAPRTWCGWGPGTPGGHGALDTFGLSGRYTGTLVSDDYNGYAKYQVRLTARQLRNAHLIRSAKGVAEAEPRLQAWAVAMIEVLRAGRKSVK